jgi:hypothetical protein
MDEMDRIGERRVFGGRVAQSVDWSAMPAGCQPPGRGEARQGERGAGREGCAGPSHLWTGTLVVARPEDSLE